MIINVDPVSDLPRIGAHNVFLDGLIITSSGVGAFAVDWRVDRAWVPDPSIDGTVSSIEVHLDSPVECDYAFLAFHNLQGGMVSIQVYDGTAWTIIASAVPPSDGSSMWFNFDAVSGVRWAVVVDYAVGQTPSMAILSIGKSLELDQGLQPGWSPIGLADASDVIDVTSEGGVLVARAFRRRPEKATMDLVNVHETWAHTTWQGYRERLIRQPWALMWSPNEDHGRTCLAWTEGSPNPDRYSAPGFLTISWLINMANGYDISTIPKPEELYTFYWVGAAGGGDGSTWTDGGNWSGVAPGYDYPQLKLHKAIFNTTSDSTSIPASVTDLYSVELLFGFNGNVAQTNPLTLHGNTLLVEEGSYHVLGAVLNTNLVRVLVSGLFDADGASVNIAGDLQLEGTAFIANSTISVVSDVSIAGAFTFIDVSLMTVQGDVEIAAATSTTYLNSTIRLTGADNQTISGGGTFPNLTVNKTSGTATLSAALTVGGVFLVEAGTFAAAGNALTCDTFQQSGGVFNAPSSTVTQRVLARTGGTITGSPRPLFVMEGTGTFSNTGSDFTARLTFDGDTEILSGFTAHGPIIFIGTVSTAAYRYIARFHGGADSIVAEPGAIFNLHADGGIGINCFNGSHGISGEFPGVSFGVSTASGNGIYLQADTLCWNISAEQPRFIRTDDFNLTVQNNLTVTSPASLLAGSSKIRVGNTLTIQAGATYTSDVGHELIFDGAGNQSISIGGHTARDITVDKTGGEARFLLSFAMSLFKCETPGQALRFQALETFTIDTLNIVGSLADPITIDRNGGSGTDQATFSVAVGQSISYVSLSNNLVSIASEVINGSDGGNNTNWSFIFPDMSVLGDDLEILGSTARFKY
jgi:hypothetical protein